VTVADDCRTVRRINHEQTSCVRREAAGVARRGGYELNRIAVRHQAAAGQAQRKRNDDGGKLLRHASSLSRGVVGEHVSEPPERRVAVGSAKLK
jgi:hypothetical protein